MWPFGKYSVKMLVTRRFALLNGFGVCLHFQKFFLRVGATFFCEGLKKCATIIVVLDEVYNDSKQLPIHHVFYCQCFRRSELVLVDL